MKKINQLSNDGINFIKHSNQKLSSHVIEINRIISDRINNCKNIFPLWLNWQYIRNLFIVPNGLSEEDMLSAAEVYYSNFLYYPYQVFINWVPQNEGNILYNDKKFVTLLYQMNDDFFTEMSKVSDDGSYIKGTIYDFIESSEQVVVVVDCENSDPYKLVTTIKNLEYEHTKKIRSIILFDDVHTASAWRILEQFIKIPAEHISVEPVKENKSLVDIMLTARTCQEHYQNNVDSFVIVYSGSDFWGLISSLLDARFLLMIQHDNCGPDLKKALLNASIFYCYIDDFYSGNTEELKLNALFKEMYHYIDTAVQLNINEMFDEALTATRLEMTSAEKKQFIAQHIKPMKLIISPGSDIFLELKIITTGRAGGLH